MRPVGPWSRRPAGPAYLEFIFYFFISLGKHYIDSEIKTVVRGPWPQMTLCMYLVYTMYIPVVRALLRVTQQACLLSHDGRLTDPGLSHVDVVTSDDEL